MKYAAVLTFAACVALLPVTPTQNSSTPNPACTLTLTQSPEIRGVRLGTTAQQLLALFPEEGNQLGITEAIKRSKGGDQFGVARFDLRADNKTVNPRFAGVSYITVEMIDERVTSFHVSYTGPEWKSTGQFVAKLSEAFSLPNDASWEQVGTTQKTLKCDGFVVNAYALESGENWVRVQDTSAHHVVEDRRQAAKEKARQTFKP